MRLSARTKLVKPSATLAVTAEVARLRASGVQGVFTPGTRLDTIIAWVRDNVHPH